MAYVLAAAPAAAAPRTPTITPAVTASDTYGVTVSFGVAGDATTFLIGLDGQHTTWKGITYNEPALVVRARQFPKAEDYFFKPLNEHVAVYQKAFRIVQDLEIDPAPQAAPKVE